MKKQLLVLIAFFLTTQLSFSQDTLANMLEVGNKWSRFYSNTKYMGYNVYGEVTKDTSIQGLQFVIVNETYVANYNNGNYPNIYNKLVLRQNKNGLYTYLNGKIEIVYQFSGLNVGDSIKTNRYIIPGFNQNSQDSITKIISIDTITVGLSKIRRFYLGSVQFAGFNYFFESIGFTCAGPLNTNPATWIDGVVNKLFCFKNKNGMFHTEGNIDIYTLFSGTSTSCSNIVSKVDDNTLLSLISLTKTSENQIQLSSSINLSNAQLTLYDMKGTAFVASMQQDNTINVSNLQAGLYVLRLQTADQKLASFKFVK